MKKIIHFLILSIFVLSFVSIKIAPTYASYATPQQATNRRPADIPVTDQHTAADDSDWVIECVDCPKKFNNLTNRYLRLDSAGNPHLVYGGDHLYYAWYDGSTWHKLTVDNSVNAGQHAALVLDEDQYQYISYYDAQNSNLKFAHRDDYGWHVEIVDPAGGTGTYTSIALDANGKAHISYYDQTNGDLKYALQDTDGWQIQTVDRAGVVGLYSSLALDQNGYPHISYYSESEGLKYARNVPEGWYTENIGGGGNYTSLVLDAAGKPHISHARDYEVCAGKGCWYYSELIYTYQDSDGWHSQILDDGGLTNATSLVVDGFGYPHISYNSSNLIKIAYLGSGGWHSQVVNTEQGGIESTSLVLDGDNQPRLSYVSKGFGLNVLKYASLGTDSWDIQSVEWEHDVGRSSLVLDKDRIAHISYRDIYDQTITDIKYAMRGETGWEIQSFDQMDYGGYSISMVLDQRDFPHISYNTSYSIDDKDELRYTSPDEQGWNIQTISTLENIDDISLTLDLIGFPHISFRSDGLNYIYQDQAGWHVQKVDSTGLDSSLVLDQGGNPHISYGTTTDLRYGHLDGEKWQIQSIDFTESYCGDTSIMLDANENAHISYLKENNLDEFTYSLAYTFWDGNEWVIQTLDNNVKGAFGTTLVIDSQDFPHISYTKEDKSGYTYPMYTYQDTTGWHFRRLAPDHPGMSEAESLDLDQNDRPHISFTDGDGLKYAFQAHPFHELAYAPTSLWGQGLPGNTITYTLLITNTGQITDTFNLSLSGHTWVTLAPAQTSSLGIGQQASLDIRSTIPPTATLGTSDTATITLTSQGDPNTTASVTVTTYAGNVRFLPFVAK